jgi:uncharacterized protein with HEPN domain
MLQDILQELLDVADFTREGELFFMHDRRTQKAVVRSYEVIGSICKQLPAELRESHPEIDWRKLIRFRDYLAHNYEYIALRYVWDAVIDAAELSAAIQAILAELPSDADPA